MKKILVLVTTLALSASAAFAQGAFSHMSLGLDLGTTGVGLQMSFPIVENHLVVSVGYNYLGFPYNKRTDFSTADLGEKVTSLNNKIADVNSQIAPYGAHIWTTFETKFPTRTNVDVAARARMSTIKALFEFYPSAKSGFHITAGAYIGISPNLIELTGTVNEGFWNDVDSFENELNTLRSEINQIKANYPECSDKLNVDIPGVPNELKFNMGGETYKVTRRSALTAAVKAWQVRPYLGVGFGKSIPDSHFSFVADLGVWYHGKPRLESPNMTTYDASATTLNFDAGKYVEKVPVWPVISLKLIYKIF
ncbi:MAG: hypothetical protein IKS47_02640 [Bacteroidales bacterium]|nr:hypothetical protein [Bacteroidales bacterium]